MDDKDLKDLDEIEEELDENTYTKLKLKTIKIEQGCSKCNYSGYKGRIAVYEILEIKKNPLYFPLFAARVHQHLQTTP